MALKGLSQLLESIVGGAATSDAPVDAPSSNINKFEDQHQQIFYAGAPRVSRGPNIENFPLDSKYTDFHVLPPHLPSRNDLYREFLSPGPDNKTVFQPQNYFHATKTASGESLINIGAGNVVFTTPQSLSGSSSSKSYSKNHHVDTSFLLRFYSHLDSADATSTYSENGLEESAFTADRALGLGTGYWCSAGRHGADEVISWVRHYINFHRTFRLSFINIGLI